MGDQYDTESEKKSADQTNKTRFTQSSVEIVRQVQDVAAILRQEIGKIIVGQDEVIEQMLIALFCRGHAVLEGVPGLAKTLLISTVARTLDLSFSRIQFTPDLMPSDITGTEVIEEDRTTGARSLRFVQGPVFGNVILADEINRTPPKTQAALLEAMQENQVTAGGVAHELPQPFFVLATQNPIEQEGTYPLPEAQLDRFMFMIRIKYPTFDQELEIVKKTTAGGSINLSAVLSGEDVLAVQRLVREVPVADHVLRYAISLVSNTRVDCDVEKQPEIVRNYISWGAGPRASQYLVLAAKAKALLEGSTHITPSHIKQMIYPVLRHRLVTNFSAEADGITSDDVITALLEIVPVSGADTQTAKQLDSIIRSPKV